MLGLEEKYLTEKKGINTAKEIEQQPRLWNETIEIIEKQEVKIKDFLRSIDVDNTKIIFTGAGTSEFIGNTLVPYLRENTLYDVESRATTDIVANPKIYIPTNKKVILVSFARSGNSPESVAAIEIANQISNKIRHVIITCNPDGKLANMNLKDSVKIQMPKDSNDLGFAMTGSFSCMLLSGMSFFKIENLKEIKNSIKELAKETSKNIPSYIKKINEIVDISTERVVFLGSGSLKGLAQEASLKVLELCSGKIPVSFDTPLGFRHGPKSIVNSKTIIFNLISNSEYSKKYDSDLINELKNDGKASAIITLSKKEGYKECINLVIGTDSENSIINALGYLFPCQMYSLLKSLSLGITPDNPCPSGEVNRVVQGVIIHKYK
ncbi:MAG: SIS domain-containing protein [Mycoplasmatales bacterium]